MRNTKRNKWRNCRREGCEEVDMMNIIIEINVEFSGMARKTDNIYLKN